MTSTSPTQVFAVITAAGSGTRLGSDRPKALVELDGMSLVEHALRNLHSGGVDYAVVTAPPERFEEFRALLETAEFRDIVRVVSGSSLSRQASVAAGLEALAQTAAALSPILIHDAARPLVSPQLVSRVIDALRAGEQAVIPGLAVADTLKSFHEVPEASAGQVQGARYVDATVDRAGLVAVQTPQGFPWKVIRELHRRAAASANSEATALTDDAGLAQQAGIPVRIVPGEGRALKITTPIDLVFARAILAEDARA